MIWLPFAALALAAFAGVLLLRAPLGRPQLGRGWEAVGAALLLGLAGYAWQGQPGVAGSPRLRDEGAGGTAPNLPAGGDASAGNIGSGANSALVIAQALMRHGEYADAATILRGAVERNPDDGQSWLAMAGALVNHADGTLSPAALMAFRRAEAVVPEQPGPPFLLGLSFVRAGQFAEARAEWAGLLARTPANAPWHPMVVMALARLDAMAAGAQPQVKPLAGR